MTRLLVAGGRTFAYRRWLNSVLNEFRRTHEIELLIHGDAAGADRLAKQWATDNRVNQRAFPAKWDDLDNVPPSYIRTNKFGKRYNVRAGFVRNDLMVTEGRPTHAILFPGGSGTDDMARRLDTVSRQCGIDPIELLDLRCGLTDIWKLTTARIEA